MNGNLLFLTVRVIDDMIYEDLSKFNVKLAAWLY
jgi:hypothetical protein